MLRPFLLHSFIGYEFDIKSEGRYIIRVELGIKFINHSEDFTI